MLQSVKETTHSKCHILGPFLWFIGNSSLLHSYLYNNAISVVTADNCSSVAYFNYKKSWSNLWCRSLFKTKKMPRFVSFSSRKSSKC